MRKFDRFRCEKRISHFTVSFISHGKRTINVRRLIRIYDIFLDSFRINYLRSVYRQTETAVGQRLSAYIRC